MMTIECENIKMNKEPMADLLGSGPPRNNVVLKKALDLNPPTSGNSENHCLNVI